MQAVKFENVHFSYKTNDATDVADVFSSENAFALHGIDLSIEEGEFVAILGHNGSGKSTLARLINGLLEPSSGEIEVFGLDAKEEKNLFEIRKQVGIVFQNPDNQMVASIVEDDVAFGPENVGINPKEIGDRIAFALDSVEMSAYRRSTPSRLSGGQKQRIAIAGVLALKPKMMILDESTAMLDPRGRKEVMDVVLKLNREEKITVLLITHFPEEAMLADRAIVMHNGEIVMQGRPEEVLKKEKELADCSLALPRSIQICRMLQRGGLPVSDALTAEEVAENIKNALEKFSSKNQVFPEMKGACTRSTKKITAEEEKGSVACKNLSHVYNPSSPFETYALNGVDLEIFSGEFFGILGHTGSGKSTFVQHLNALLKVPSAEKKYKPKKLKKGQTPIAPTVLRVDGFDLTDKTTDFKALRSKVGMVFQYPEYQLFAETVFEDVAFGLKNFNAGLTPVEIETAVRDALETVGLCYNEIKNRSPLELSGGQKRRVAIAGVIVTKPEILVLDEPAAGLDPLGKETIMQTLHKIHADWCKTVIIVSHDMDEIAENCNRAAIFSDGKILKCGEPQELFEDAEQLQAVGLDAPFTAKVVAKLKENGVNVSCDYTRDDFVLQTLRFAQQSASNNAFGKGGAEHA